MLDRLGELYKVPVYETPVGFKYVAPVMIAKNALMAGKKAAATASAGTSRSGMRFLPDFISWILW